MVMDTEAFVRQFHNFLGLGTEKTTASFYILDIVYVSMFSNADLAFISTYEDCNHYHTAHGGTQRI